MGFPNAALRLVASLSRPVMWLLSVAYACARCRFSESIARREKCFTGQ